MKTRMLLAMAALLTVAGVACADEISRDSMLTAFQRGGSVMWAILAVSIFGYGYAIERFVSLLRVAQIPRRLMDGLRDEMVRGGVAAGLEVVGGGKSAMARVMYALLSRSGATRRELETVLEDEGTRVLFGLRKNLRPIGVAAVVAPQLGLLGTVFGLIAAFRTAAELGMDDPRNFAAGIYEALYTTAFGLVVAIPLLIVHSWLRTRADTIMREVEERALAFISAASNRAETARRSADGGRAAEVFETESVSCDEPTTIDDEGPRADAEDTSVQEA
ncbi:MAG: MotA/TolQ/ExbB proton channel family protein [Planctomycetota bacterium]|jgi:biopolymer transport protein ExbB|nr:MotA/TolQ/ExbB proton channel family protein [Planctomycetota bacterium]